MLFIKAVDQSGGDQSIPSELIIISEMKNNKFILSSHVAGSKEVVILVQNVGNSTLKATLSANGISKHLEIHKHQNGKVKIVGFCHSVLRIIIKASILDDKCCCIQQ